MENNVRRNGMLYPLLVTAAIAMIIFSGFGIATMAGWMPRAESKLDVSQQAQQPQSAPLPPQAAYSEPAPAPVQAAPAYAPRYVAQTTAPNYAPPVNNRACNSCGVIESIHTVTVKGKSSPIGVIAGGLAGGLLGHQIGNGGGNTIATIAGAAGGAYAGSEVEKNVKKTTRYEVRLHMDNGTTRTYSQTAAPQFAIGERVRLINGRLESV